MEFHDSGSVVPETNEPNNRGYNSISITGRPDLQVTYLTINPTSQVAGGNVVVTWRVSNVGSTATGAGVPLRFYYSTDSTIDASDTAAVAAPPSAACRREGHAPAAGAHDAAPRGETAAREGPGRADGSPLAAVDGVELRDAAADDRRQAGTVRRADLARQAGERPAALDPGVPRRCAGRGDLQLRPQAILVPDFWGTVLSTTFSTTLSW